MPARPRMGLQLDSMTRTPTSPQQSDNGMGHALLLGQRGADASSEDEGAEEYHERRENAGAHERPACADAAAGRVQRSREGVAEDDHQDEEECSGLLEEVGAWIGRGGARSPSGERRKLDSALLRSPGSMPGWGGSWGGGDGSKEHESLDFDTVNTPFWVDASRQPQKRGFMHGVGHAMMRSKQLYQWLFTVGIGVLVALSAKLIQVLIALLITARNQRMQEYYDAGSSDNNIFIFFAGYNALLVVSAGVLALCAGSSGAGDGVAEVKAYLNGSHIRGCFNLRAILCKIVGTALASAAALACGPEGPMIHIGAGIAYAITCIDNLSSVLPALTPSILARFTNDRDRREFIAAGAGAGIAAAFGAPIGGVLFALEEAASHWSPQLIWRIFTSAMVATFTLALIRAGGHSGDISLAGLLSSGTKISMSESKGGVMINPDGSSMVSVMDAPVYVWELVLFVGLGAIGGMLGGLLNASYNLLAPRRPKSRIMRLVEVLFLSLGTSYTLFFLAAISPRCTTNGTWTCRDADNWGDRCTGPADNSTCVGMRAQCVNATGWMCVGGQNNGLACVGRGGFEDCEWRGGSCQAQHQSHRFFGLRANCQEGEYHELATLFFGDKSSSIIRMVTQSTSHQDAPFSNQSLIIAAAAYQVLMMATYGAPLAVGFFMPCWLVGTALGRLFGQLVNAHLSSQNLVYSGAYALAGAAAMLGGVQRASISLIFFIIEGTSNVHFLLPIVTTLLSANMVSRLFAPEGVLDLALRHNTLRFLPHNPDWLMQLSTVADVMGGPVRTLRAVESIGTIVDLLRSCHHNGFPVVGLPPKCENPAVSATAPHYTATASYASLPVDFEGPPGQGGVAGHADCDSLDEIGLGGGVKSGNRHAGRGRLEGIILRSHLRHILGARFMRDGGTPNSLWQRVTSPPSAWPASTQMAAAGRGSGEGGVMPLVGDPEMYELIEYRRRRIEVATVKEWEWGMFCEEDRSRLVNLASYMNAACYTVHQGCTVARAYSLFRSMGLRHLPVVDAHGCPVGMLSRANFSERTLHRMVRRYYTHNMLWLRPDHRELSAQGPGLDTRTWPRLEGTRKRIEHQRTRDPVAAEEVEENFFGAAARRRRGAEMQEFELREGSGRSQEARERMPDSGRRLTTGGPVDSWQSRLLNVLDRERERDKREMDGEGGA